MTQNITEGYSFFVADTETTSLDYVTGSIIELSLYRLSDNVQKTWFIKPIEGSNIEVGALRVNGHKMEDLKGETKYGQDTYMEAMKAIVEIENFVAECGVPSSNICLVGHNIGSFDIPYMQQLWAKCSSKETYPFSRIYFDTMVFEMMTDYASGTMAEGYSLASLAKRYGVKNSKAHSAAADTLATKEIFEAQIKSLREKLK